jgi:UDP-N-acetylmuramyl tripeptide synthase
MRGSEIAVRTPEGELELSLPLPGLYNVYNALAAIAGALQLDVGVASIKKGLEAMHAVFGRVETIDVEGKALSILLIKNPAGANEVLRTLRLEADGQGLDLWIALNDGIADGRDVSWIWDADFELLVGAARRITCSGTRAPEMALRLKYAGLEPESIAVEDRIGNSLERALAATDGELFALPTYTALLELRKLLARKGLAKDYWE